MRFARQPSKRQFHTQTPGGYAKCDDPGTVTWEGELSSECIGGVCVSGGTRSDGASSTISTAVVDPAEIGPGVEACASDGLTSAHYTGLTSYPIPPF